MAAENGMPENEDIRKKALLRLAIAGVITASALAGLWWLDQGSGKEKPAPPQVTSPAPIVPATPPPPSEPAAAETAGPTQPEAPAAGKPAEVPPPTPSEPPPPPKVSNGPRAPQAASQPVPRPLSSPPTPPAPAQSAPSAIRPAPTPTVPADPGFVVQLGVFSNPDNAREMVDKLNKKGIRAHLEARVQLGPFLNRQEAEKAQVEMRKLGYSGLVTTAYPANPGK